MTKKIYLVVYICFQAEDGIRDAQESRGLGGARGKGKLQSNKIKK